MWPFLLSVKWRSVSLANPSGKGGPDVPATVLSATKNVYRELVDSVHFLKR